MDPRRFDSLTRRLGARVSRRDTVRLGAGMALGAAALGPVRSAVVQDTVLLETSTTPDDRFVALSFYPFDGDFDEAQAGLKPLIRLMQQQPGFVTMAFIEGDGAIYLVTTFLDKTTSEAGTAAINAWIAENDPGFLIETPERDSGAVFLRSQQPTGCWCLVDDEQACGGGDELYCCTLPDEERGICLNEATMCPTPDDDEAEEVDEDDPTPTATATSTVDASSTSSSCTSDGCSCTSGLDGACDAGLLCCGAGELGGTGICMAVCPCGSEGCECIAAVVNTCDEGLTCCAPGEIGGRGTCQASCSCTALGCACTTGIDGACDEGLSCCGIGSNAPGSIGACLAQCATDSPCPGSEGCECGTVWKCDDGLICCGATEDGGTGICQANC